MEKILTVVIPTYNGEKYVERAVRSILGQPAGSSLKVLLVNDGSTDSSGAICDELAHGHENVSVIHKPNGGVSSARIAHLVRDPPDQLALRVQHPGACGGVSSGVGIDQ